MWWIFRPSDPELDGRLAALEAPRPSEGLRTRLYGVVHAPAQERKRPATRRPLVALVAGSCVAAALLLTAVDRSGPAMADVVRSLGDVRTATWTETRRMFHPTSAEPTEISSEMWVRIDPPALSRSNANGFRSLIDRRGQLVYRPAPQDQYTLGESIGKLSREVVVAAIAAPSDKSPHPLGTGWQRSTLTENGRSYLQFRRVQESGDPPVRATQVVRVDPATLHVVRSESRWTYPGKDETQSEVVADGYRYNVPAPEGTFDWSPPAGVRVAAEDYTYKGGQTVPPAELREIEAVIRRSDEGWVRGDWERFASAWDFAALDRFPLVKQKAEQRREALRTRLENHARFRPWRSAESRITRAMPSQFIIPYGSLPKGEPGIVMAVTSTKVTWGEGQSEEVTGHYYLTRTPKGYRILLWDQPDPAPYVGRAR